MSAKDPRLRIRVEFDGGHTLGPGKVQLLEAVEELGSISAAARSMAMSYRHAWELLDDVNQCFRGRVFRAEAGGKAGGGAQLTDFGRQLIQRYRGMQQVAQKALAPNLKELEAARREQEEKPGAQRDSPLRKA